MKSSAVREMPDEIRIHPTRIKLGITAVDLFVPELISFLAKHVLITRRSFRLHVWTHADTETRPTRDYF